MSLRLTAIMFVSSVIFVAACSHRSLTGTAYYCACYVPPFGHGGCGSGPGFPFDSWACVGPGDTPEVNCAQACQQEAGPTSGVWLGCVDDGGGRHDEPVLHPEPAFADRCTPPTAAGVDPLLLATAGHLSSYWNHVAERSHVSVHNERDARDIPLESGVIALYMPNGMREVGPLTFDMLGLVGKRGKGAAITFDGNTIADFRLLNAGKFSGQADPSYSDPGRHPGQINAYKIGAGAQLNYALLFNGEEVSNNTSNPEALSGYIYSEPSASIYGGMDYFFVYEGSYTVGDTAAPSTLTMHLEFKYGGSRDRPLPPSLEIHTKFSPEGDDVEIIVVPTPPASSKAPKVTYRHTWVKGNTVEDGELVLSTSANPVFNLAKLKEKWLTLILQAEEAEVWRTIQVCLQPGLGC